MNLALIYAFTLCFTLCLLYYTASAFQWFSYRLNRVLFHFAKPRWHLYFFVLPLAAFVATEVLSKSAFGVGTVAVFYAGLVLFWSRGLDKKLVFTARVKRIFAFVVILFSFCWFLKIPAWATPLLSIAFALIFSNASEALLAKYYQQKALKKLKENKDLKIILITASFGKTSIKNFMFELLKQDFVCYKTPRSVNTLGGIVRDINENLPPNCQIYIAEAGARQTGDIKEIAQFLQPQVVVVGQIGKAHIEYFKTLENIRNTKLEALQSRRLEAVFLHSSALGLVSESSGGETGRDEENYSEAGGGAESCSGAGYNETSRNEALAQLAKRLEDSTESNFTALFAAAWQENLSKSNLNLAQRQNPPQTASVVVYDDQISAVKSSLDGLEFEIEFNHGEQKVHFCASLLGAFNAQNIGVSLLVARRFGVSQSVLENAVKRLAGVPNRLALMRMGGKVIIDDSFNGNFSGMKESYALASQWAGRKVLLTPGLVEAERAQNEELARLMNEVFDIVVITSELNYAVISPFVTKPQLVTLFEKHKMQEWLLENTRGGDLILFSNDAPSFI